MAACNPESNPWIADLLLQYLAAVPLRRVDKTCLVDALGACEDDWASEALQRNLLQSICLSAHALQYPPSRSYRSKFLKWLITTIEACGHGTVDELYSLFSETASLGELCPGDQAKKITDLDGLVLEGYAWKSYRVHQGPGGLVPVLENEQMLSNGTTGLTTWPAAITLAEWVVEHQDLLKDKHVVELGSGAGLGGLTVLHCACPATLTLTDYHASVLRILRRNVEESQSLVAHQCKVYVETLDWATTTEETADRLHANVILAADVVFDSVIVPDLSKTLSLLLQSCASAAAYVASTVRNEDTLDGFLSCCQQEGLVVVEQPLPPQQATLYTDRSWKIKIHKLSKPTQGSS